MEALPIGSGNLWVNLAVLLLSVLVVAFFSSSEASLISVSKIRVRHLAEQGNRAAQAVQRVLGQHDKFFATILLTENAFIIFASSMGTALAIAVLGEGRRSVIVATAVMTVLIVTFGEITPKTLALQGAERLSLLVARPIEWVIKLETVFIYLFTLVPNALLKLLGGRHLTASPFVTQAELRMLVDIGEAEGTVRESEGEMIQRVFRFGDRRVGEIMIPRPEVVAVEHDLSLAEFWRRFAQSPHTRFPVYEGDLDNVVGVVSIKDVLIAQEQGRSQDTTVREVMREAFFVPETKQVADLFAEMRSRGRQMALVVDEHGGTAGLTTLHSLMEEIVGRVSDEYVEEPREFETIDERTVQVDGGMRIDQANEELKLGLPEGHYETVAGFVLEQLGRIPRPGDRFTHDGLLLVVTRIAGNRIESVLVTRI